MKYTYVTCMCVLFSTGTSKCIGDKKNDRKGHPLARIKHGAKEKKREGIAGKRNQRTGNDTLENKEEQHVIASSTRTDLGSRQPRTGSKRVRIDRAGNKC